MIKMGFKNKIIITNKHIICFYLILFILLVIPIMRPFVSVFITLSVSVYLKKIYNNVDNSNKEDIKKFKEDFEKAYSDLQAKIKKFKNDVLERDDLEYFKEYCFIKTNLRFLMEKK